MKHYFFILPLLLLFTACSDKVTMPAHQTQTSGNNELKVLCYNIHHANPPSKEGLIDLDAIANVIKAENPDVVALQEIDRLTKRSGGIDEAKLLAQKTGMKYHFFRAIDHDGGEYGTMILSKHPFSDIKSISLPEAFPGEDRILAYVTVKMPSGKTFILANTHLDAQRNNDTRTLQMKTILQELSAKREPIILCGDLNSVDTSEAIKLLDQQFKRTCILNCPGTIPVINPTKTIDYIAIKNATWPVKSHIVIPETYASDHRPLVVTFQMN
ncbi:endonuclease/exonuclease/phosphatase [Pedobacter polaris]|uniref:Endonuclease/exonuclease/phosphatase n=1 Tax=Pedobacter polaris TaxID=2571273 RepID=A0A4U1CMX2_9SPHI|nr:endonuclease/exonuclease/phosphatase family protein [Pedobacter polaris]TKC07908.1 endonuclease/exonuclease/phosphatase [Pedobacter polaris]